MKCEICKSTEFSGVKAKGSCCTTCYPQSIQDVKKWIVFNEAPVSICKGSTKDIGRNIEVDLRCTDCSTKFSTTPAKLTKLARSKYHPCPTCRKENFKVNLSNAVKRLHETGELKASRKYTPKQYANVMKKRKIKPLEDFAGVSVSILHECLVCSHTFKNSPNNILKSTKGCSICSGKKLKTHEDYVRDLEMSDSIFTPMDKYVNAKTPIRHLCVECGFVKTMSPTNALKDGGSARYCPKHSPLKGFKRKTILLGSREIAYQGFNDKAIRLLLDAGIKADEIVSEYEGVPKVTYRYKGIHRHFPDIFVPSKNLLVEVKSEFTIGITPRAKSASKWYAQCAKYKGAVKQGFNYKLVLYTNFGERVTLPDNWYDYSFREALSSISTSSSF